MKPVLVVEDKAENRYDLEALLRGRGDPMLVARHSAEAVVLARDSRRRPW
jgi:CheY-like chemotaxis protein